VGDPILKSNRTRRIDFALFMVEALENDELINEAPAIVVSTASDSSLNLASAGIWPERSPWADNPEATNTESSGVS